MHSTRHALRAAAWWLCLPLLVLSCSPPDREPMVAAGAPADWELRGTSDTDTSPYGMVVSGHHLASEVGVEVLERGGNAIDAAVAVGFALAAVLPRAGNIGGGGFLVYRPAAGEVRALDFRETAPAAAHRDMYLGPDGEPTEASVLGALAAGVPGSVAGLWEMHRELGSQPWAELVSPAVELAREHLLDEVRAADIAFAADKLELFESSADHFLAQGTVPAAGTPFRQPDLARTLERIAEEGADGFYRGPVADLIVAEMERSGGIITRFDLSSYEAVWREPVESTYRGYTLLSMAPPSSGGVTLAELLNIVEGYEPLPPFASADLVGLETEVMRRAFIDRNRHLGDPAFVEVPLERLTSKAYADDLRSSIDPARPTPTSELELGFGEGSETTHYSIVDGYGNAASVTTTLNGHFGSKLVVRGAGFLLNNEMDDFASAPGKPNQYGLVEGEANAIEPGKRMLSSMTPTIVLDPGGELFLVVGSPGGPTIITTVYHVLSNLVDHGMTPAEAVEAPRTHHQALPDVVYFEPDGLLPEVVEELVARGYELEERQRLSGNVSAIVAREGGWLGVADPRRRGAAVGVETLPGEEEQVAQSMASGASR